ncbi:MAG TPA: hypothetical protein VER04_27400 [Polyangiaceae bacterium]|nr:hypothetical protein [Polyangiaceae bacterium]
MHLAVRHCLSCAWLLVGVSLACSPSNTPVREPVAATLRADRMPTLAVADALEALVARAADTPADRKYAYQRVRAEPVSTAQDALGHAIIAGRLAQISGLAAPGLVAEVERFARRSAELDPAFRAGAAQRLLGTLYVMAPAALLSHGDSEAGLELLQGVVRRFPAHLPNRLRLAEAYVALGDQGPARPLLCECRARRATLRLDEQKLLDELSAQTQLGHCP